jgi:hypothetical protein
MGDSLNNPIDKINQWIQDMQLGEILVGDITQQEGHISQTNEEEVVTQPSQTTNKEQFSSFSEMNSVEIKGSKQVELQFWKRLTIWTHSPFKINPAMIALILHCNGTQTPNVFFDSMAILKKEINLNKFDVSMAPHTQDTPS